MSTLISSVLDIGSIIIWAGVVVQVFKLAEDNYGGNFTSVFPSLLAGTVLMLLLGVMEWVHSASFVTQGSISDTFAFGMNTLQLIGGIFLLMAVSRIYSINFAVSGFMFGEDE